MLDLLWLLREELVPKSTYSAFPNGHGKEGSTSATLERDCPAQTTVSSESVILTSQ